MASLWKYITEMNMTDVAVEDSDLVIINQGGNSVQIPWLILKAGLENKIQVLDETLDNTAYISAGLVVDDDPDMSYDALVAKVAKMGDNIVNLQNLVEQISSSLRITVDAIKALHEENETLRLENQHIKWDIDNLPTIKFGDEKPEDVLEQLSPKEGDVYIYTGNEVIE